MLLQILLFLLKCIWGSGEIQFLNLDSGEQRYIHFGVIY